MKELMNWLNDSGVTTNRNQKFTYTPGHLESRIALGNVFLSREACPRPPPPRAGRACRAHGGCLGAGSRRRARQAAIVPGEPHAGLDPGVPEWGNPGSEGSLPFRRTHILQGGNRGN